MKERLRTLWGILFPPTIEFLTGDDPCPKKAHEHDACDDLKAAATYTILPGKTIDIESNRAANIPYGYYVEIVPRSGLSKAGITVVGSPKTIDAGYTGNWILPLKNESTQVYTIHCDDRIAQFRLVRIQRWKGKRGTKARDSSRGDKGFGSSGR